MLDKDGKPVSDTFLSGKTSLSLTNNASKKEGKTYATIGRGNISVGEITYNGK